MSHPQGDAAGVARVLAAIRLLPHQLSLVRNNTARVLVLKGGLRAGKTVGAVWKAIVMALQAWPLPILVFEPTYQMLRDVFLETARRVLEEKGIPYAWHATHYILTVFPRSDKPLRLFLRSMDRPERIIGFTAGGALIDEWESCPWDSVKRTRERVTPGPKDLARKQLVLVGSPEGFGPGYEFAEQNPPPGLEMIVARTVDNPFVGEEYIRNVREMLSEGEARERLEGIRTAKEGAVYTRFSRAKHCGPPCIDDGELEIAADFNVGMMAWVFVLVDTHGQRMHVVGELVGRNTDTMEQSERAAHWIADWYTRTTGRRHTRDDVRRMRIKVCMDASGAARSAVVPLSHATTLMQAGFQPQYPASNPRVEDRVASVQRMLARDPPSLTIDAKAAPYLVRCLEAQPYDKAGYPSKDPKLALDHAVDALGYAVFWHFPAWKPAPNQPQTPSARARFRELTAS